MSDDQPDPFSCLLTVNEMSVLIRLAGGELPDTAGWVGLVGEGDRVDPAPLLEEAAKSLLARGLTQVHQDRIEACAPLLAACGCVIHPDWTLTLMSTTPAGQATFFTIFGRGFAGTLLASADFGNLVLRYQPDSATAVERVLNAVAQTSVYASAGQVADDMVTREELDVLLAMPDVLINSLRLEFDTRSPDSDCCWLTTPTGSVLLDPDRSGSLIGRRATARSLRERLADYCQEVCRPKGDPG